MIGEFREVREISLLRLPRTHVQVFQIVFGEVQFLPYGVEQSEGEVYLLNRTEIGIIPDPQNDGFFLAESADFLDTRLDENLLDRKSVV